MVTRILVAEDHRLVAAGYQALLEAFDDFRIVGGVSDGREVVAAIAEHRPDLLLLDLSLPGRTGLDLLPLLREKVVVVVVTAHTHPSYVQRALALGAAGYVLKRDSPRELVDAIRAARRGEVHVSSSIPRDQLDRPAADDPYDRLNEREREVLRFTAQGWTTPQIAGHVGLSVRGVENYRRRARAKLGVRNQSELVRWMVHREALDPDSI